MHKSRGFTLIELMVTITVLAIIAMMAAPSLGLLLEKQRFQGKERELLSVLAQTKSQAILKRTNTTVNLNSTSANTDTAINWDKGANITLTIQTLSSSQTLGSYSGTSLIFDKNGLVSSLSQDALISLCNSNLKKKKQLVLTRLGAVYTKPEGAC
ncbi:GspH/FimT family pseudopilin [Acinetobacter kanungonis]|uniref:GspH/FimT family pseudopilin n=1 Tax=Acinetobacter kanungonis TaxID=2699469 RepID=UPI00137A7B79|nr:GspH/FimT family pseudopilin [Acinetobacter kanungonis]NCI78012.1 prepilin-type N-terminal cleavage/methylation domain-containing protein [Acinetobacter kanungonis]